MKKFIILTTQRTGSTLLWRYLNEHPNISAHGEMMLMSMQRTDSYSAFIKTSIKRRITHFFNKNKSLKNYFDELFRENTTIEATGFKLMYNQVSKALDNWIYQNKISIIHLIRENTLKMILSRMTAKKRNLYHTSEINKITPTKIRVDTKNILKEICDINNEIDINKIKYQNNPYLEIKYENIQKNIYEETEKIYAFLGVKDVNGLKIPLKKLNPDNLNEVIENYDEIEKLLKNTKYHNFLY